MPHLRPVVPALVFLLSGALALGGPAACSGTGGSGSGNSFSPIVQADLQGLPVSNAREAIQRLRPAWLRHRGATSIQDPTPRLPVVYVDGTRRGPIEELERISLPDIQEIRYLSASDATTRFGTGHAAGVIEVSTRR